MKIVHIILTPRFAGSERYAIELANAQSAHHEVSVILHRRAAEARPDALAHRLLPAVRQIHVGGWWWWTRWQVRRALQALAPDVAHAHLSLACRSLRGFAMPGLRVATLHIRYKPQQHADLDALIAIAPWQVPEVPPAQQPHTRQIDNWTDPPPFDAATRARMRRELGLGEDDFLIGALGRTEASKGLDVLLRAYERVRRPGLRLAVVGAGRQWASLRRQAAADVLMPGFVERPHEWFAAFDAFVSAAHSEPFGLVLLEAMASGLPVLATASEGARHLAPLIGRPLVPCGDETALAAALRALADERPLRRPVDLHAHGRAAKVAEIEAFYAESRARLRSNSQTR